PPPGPSPSCPWATRCRSWPSWPAATASWCASSAPAPTPRLTPSTQATGSLSAGTRTPRCSWVKPSQPLRLASRRKHERRPGWTEHPRAARDEAEARLPAPRGPAGGRAADRPAAGPRPRRDGALRGRGGGVRQLGQLRRLGQPFRRLGECPGGQATGEPPRDLQLVAVRRPVDLQQVPEAPGGGEGRDDHPRDLL